MKLLILACALVSFVAAQSTTDDSMELTTTATCVCTNYSDNGNAEYDDQGVGSCIDDDTPYCTPDWPYTTNEDSSCVCDNWSDLAEALATAIIIAIVIGSLVCCGIVVAILCCVCGGIACCCAAGAGAGAAAGTQQGQQQNQMTTV